MFQIQAQEQDQANPRMWRTKRRLKGIKESITKEELLPIQINIVTLLTTKGLIDEQKIVTHMVAATCHSERSIQIAAENKLRSIHMDLESPITIREIYDFYKGNAGRHPIEQEKRKLMGFLVQSKEATQQLDNVMIVLKDTLFQEYATTTMQRLGFDFFQWNMQVGFESNGAGKELFLEANFKFQRIIKAYEQHQHNLFSDDQKEHYLLTMALIAKRFPELVKHQYQYIQDYYTALAQEPEKPMQMVIQQALSQLIYAYFPLSNDIQQSLYHLFQHILQHQRKHTNLALAALKGMNRLFPFHHLPSTFLTLTMIDHPAQQIREEAERGLSLKKEAHYQHTLVGHEEHHLPSFDQLVDYMNKETTKTPLNAICMTRLLQFIKMVMKEDEISIANLTKMSLEAYMHLIQQCYRENATGDSLLEANKAYLQVLIDHRHDDLVHSWMRESLPAIFKVRYRGHPLSRTAHGQLIAILFIELNLPELWKTIWEPLVDDLQTHLSPTRVKFSALVSLGTIIALSPTMEPPFLPIMDKTMRLLDHHDTHDELYEAASLVIGSFGMFNGFYKLEKLNESQFKVIQEEATKKIDINLLNRTKIMHMIKKKLKRSSTSDKLKEHIILSLGQMTMADDLNKHFFDEVLDVLFSMANLKASEVLFSIGEALASLCGGTQYCSLYTSDQLFQYETKHKHRDSIVAEQEEQDQMLDEAFAVATEGPEVQASHFRDDYLKMVLQRLVQKGVLSGKKIVRQSTGIWLLAVVNYCGSMPALQPFLSEIQSAFSILLTDTNEVTQEIASKGLSTVYSLGSDDVKKNLMDSLVTSLSKKNKNISKIKKEEDSELLLFPSGSDMQTKNKNVPGTYKELISCATDIGQPQMIYQLLNVSQHNALWNAKKAAAFSVLSISNDSLGDQRHLKAVLPKLIPKLYRYQYDPNPLISDSMGRLWSSLVDNTQATVKQYTPQIMKELLRGISSSLWRVRQSSIDALASCFTGRIYEELADYVVEAHESLFCLCDDHKDTVRAAATRALQKVGEFSIKSCNPTYTPSSRVEEALNQLIPLYLHKGVVFPFEPIIHFSIKQLYGISKASKSLITPHVSDIVGTLLEQMSSLEPRMLSYAQVRNQFSQSDIESIRLSLSKSGPVEDTISLLGRFVNEEVMETLVPRLKEILNIGVGLPTRCGTARFLGDLGKFNKKALKKFTPSLLPVMLQSLQASNSPAERKTLALAIPYVLKCSTFKRGKALVQSILDMYTNERTTDEDHYYAGLLIRSISKHVLALIRRLYDQVVPIIFIARHDPIKKVADIWNDVLNDTMTTSLRETSRQHLLPISKTCSDLLNHQEWRMKKQGAEGINEIATLLSLELDSTVRKQLIDTILTNLSGQIWKGKEVLLMALANLCKMHPKNTLSDWEPLIKTLFRECQRKGPLIYTSNAYQAFSHLLHTDYVHLSSSLASTIQHHLLDLLAKERESEKIVFTDQQKLNLLSSQQQLKTYQIHALGGCFPKPQLDETFMNQLCSLLIGFLSSSHSVYEARAFLSASSYFLDYHILHSLKLSASQLSSFYDALLFCLNPSHSSELIRLDAMVIFQTKLLKLIDSFNASSSHPLSIPNVEQLQVLLNLEPIHRLRDK
eukprot:CAMPEP_0117433086 /NCGR_PEP_ID=MMETSP0758-20121206/12495_1 /TAXON_ID=63605 /ORGANISM="Percolomonas cosmopolitus, Strain AE-1 (ATCC 50343)" /LENGTH=1615 /DNA_ID=CAMNT_0005223493 /DNA_START=128 /DNA_END=4972 /DNA_ORIENTATION=-